MPVSYLFWRDELAIAHPATDLKMLGRSSGFEEYPSGHAWLWNYRVRSGVV